MAVQSDFGLSEWQRLPVRHPQLPLHQIQPGDGFGDGVFDLQPGVHLHEIELAIGEQEFHGARADVADFGRHQKSGGTHALANLLRQSGSGRFFDDLLVAALDGAVAIPQVDRMAVRIGEDLHFDVPGSRQVALHEECAVGKRALREPSCAGKRSCDLCGLGDDAHAFAAAP